MPKETGCEFCDIVAGRAFTREVLRTPDVVAFFPTEPAALGHVLVIPTSHASTIYELNSAMAEPLAMATIAVAQAIHDTFAPAGLNVIQSNGAAATQTVPHVHVHVVPRDTNDALGTFWPKVGVTDTNALDDARVRLATTLSKHQPSTLNAEDRRHHLQLVSNVIERLSKASARTKGWAVAVSGAAFGAGSFADRWEFSLIGLAALLVFLDQDTRYLREERLYIALFKAADAGKITPFNMEKDSFRTEVDSYGKILRSWSVLRFYLAFLALGVTATIGGIVHERADDVAVHVPNPAATASATAQPEPGAPTSPPAPEDVQPEMGSTPTPESTLTASPD